MSQFWVHTPATYAVAVHSGGGQFFAQDGDAANCTGRMPEEGVQYRSERLPCPIGNAIDIARPWPSFFRYAPNPDRSKDCLRAPCGLAL